MQLREGSIEPNSEGINIPQKQIFYTNGHQTNYPFINISRSISNVTWKLTKTFSHIISNRLLSGYSLYSGRN